MTYTAGHTDQIRQLLGVGLARDLDACFAQIDWAEDEIRRAQHRYRRQSDLLHHSFRLLSPTHDLMSTEFVYRSHCCELLDRVAARADTCRRSRNSPAGALM
jgi:hypothetical protein